MPGHPVTDEPTALAGTAAGTVYRLGHSGGHSRLYYEIAPDGSPPAAGSEGRDVLLYAQSEYVSHRAGQAIYVWGSTPGATFQCTLNELAG